MDLTITLPTETETRVLDTLCRVSGHEPCDDQTTCAQTHVKSMITSAVQNYERGEALRIAIAQSTPLEL